MRGILSVLGLCSAGDLDTVRTLRLAWPEMDYEYSRGRWRAYPLNGTGDPVTARSPDALLTAIREAWVAT